MKHEFIKNPVTRYAANLLNLKDARNYCKYMKVENGIAYATDSRALISFDIGLDNGFYECIKNTKTRQEFIKIDIDFI